MRCTGQIASRIEKEYVTVEQLVETIQSDDDLTNRKGIGPKTAEVIEDWWENRFDREEKIGDSSFERTGSKTGTLHSNQSWDDAIDV